MKAQEEKQPGVDKHITKLEKQQDLDSVEGSPLVTTSQHAVSIHPEWRLSINPANS